MTPATLPQPYLGVGGQYQQRRGEDQAHAGGGSKSAGAFVCVLEGRAHGVRQNCPKAK